MEKDWIIWRFRKGRWFHRAAFDPRRYPDMFTYLFAHKWIWTAGALLYVVLACGLIGLLVYP